MAKALENKSITIKLPKAVLRALNQRAEGLSRTQQDHVTTLILLDLAKGQDEREAENEVLRNAISTVLSDAKFTGELD